MIGLLFGILLVSLINYCLLMYLLSQINYLIYEMKNQTKGYQPNKSTDNPEQPPRKP